MEKYNFNGYKFNKRAVINKGKSHNIFAKLSYKKLQDAARELNLPVQLKHKVLLALVIAKTEGRNEIVNVILKSKSQKASVPIDPVHQITVPNHADSDPTLYSVQYSSSSSDTADFSSARTDSADATMFDAFLAPNESTFAQENAADMSLSLPEPSFGSENYAFCSGTSDDINIYNESKVCVNSTRSDVVRIPHAIPVTTALMCCATSSWNKQSPEKLSTAALDNPKGNYARRGAEKRSSATDDILLPNTYIMILINSLLVREFDNPKGLEHVTIDLTTHNYTDGQN
ncbi:hypothetical protein HUJ04_012334 [Dendroctonus ponderosae]|nr:hypothetical protein HUJ04_012334 [Dendroctonus ponderosae]